jgi:hypothetical protein
MNHLELLLLELPVGIVPTVRVSIRSRFSLAAGDPVRHATRHQSG